MIVTAAKIIFMASTVLMCLLTIKACMDQEVNWQIQYSMVAMSLGCVGNVSNWRRYKKEAG
jgi:hypothetical protein